MKKLNLRDLEFNSMNYKKKGDGLREWLLASLEFYPTTFADIARKTRIKYQNLWNFVNYRTAFLRYKSMFDLRGYIKDLMIKEIALKNEEGDSKKIENFKKKSCFEG